MTDPYAVGLSADKLWSPEELGAACITVHGRAYALEGEPPARPSITRQGGTAHDLDLNFTRHNTSTAVSFGALFILLLAVYALSPGGIESVLNTLAIAALTLLAAFIFRVWDELRLLWTQNRGQNPAKAHEKTKLS